MCEVFTPLGKTPVDQYRTRINPFYKGEHNYFDFPNHYRVTAVKFPGSYGYDEDLFEVAILSLPSEDFKTRDFFPEENDDVIGFLSEQEVIDILMLFTRI